MSKYPPMTHRDYNDPKYPTTFDKNVPLETNPHYTNKRFEQEQTVFGEARSDLFYNYNDRLWQWDYNKHEEAWKVAEESGKKKYSCAFYEAYLSAYFGKKITIYHIVAGVNRSNGYPYCAFGYLEE